MDKKIEKISNIIEPEKFVKKHVEDPKFLFEEVLKDSPKRNNIANESNQEISYQSSPKKIDFWDNETELQ